MAIGNQTAIGKKANRLGFWNSINPFAGYINTDKGIVENIMNRYKEILKIIR